MLLGFGIGLDEVLRASANGFLDTLIAVIVIMLLGIIVGKALKLEKNTALLIASGTAICGGSAIAAVAPILNSKNNQISLALGIVFVLNAVSLFIFPTLGEWLGLSQEVFGNWVAIAIHDTSSVVGAASVYGEEALWTATTIKLVRTLWIIPLALTLAFTVGKENKNKIKIPWFILYFIIAILLATYLPFEDSVFSTLSSSGKRLMVVALFFIGNSISLSNIKESGPKGFLLGIILWVIAATGSLIYLTSS
ncbi:MAG: putative sulfate exporter family transporter [Candidatus Kapaibacteriales bacterium]